MVNTNRHISFFSFTSFSHKENVLFFSQLTLAFLLKTLGTLFAPPIFLLQLFQLKQNQLIFNKNLIQLLNKKSTQNLSRFLFIGINSYSLQYFNKSAYYDKKGKSKFKLIDSFENIEDR